MLTCTQSFPLGEQTLHAWQGNDVTYYYGVNRDLPGNQNCCIEVALKALDMLAGQVDIWCGPSNLYREMSEHQLAPYSAEGYFINSLSKPNDAAECSLKYAVRMIQNGWSEEALLPPQAHLALKINQCGLNNLSSFEQEVHQGRLKDVPKQFNFGASAGQTGRASLNRNEIMTQTRYFFLESHEGLCQKFEYLHSGNFSGNLVAGCQTSEEEWGKTWFPQVVSAMSPTYYCQTLPELNKSSMYLSYAPKFWDPNLKNVDAHISVLHTFIDCSAIEPLNSSASIAYPSKWLMASMLAFSLMVIKGV